MNKHKEKIEDILRETTIIPRNKGWEEILEPLIRKITGVQQGKVRSGCNYENDVFTMRMHYMGGCSCQYIQIQKEFDKSHPHTQDCFHTQWHDINQTFRSHPQYSNILILKISRINMERQLCLKYNIPYNAETILESICTCPYDAQWKALNMQHEEQCKLLLPNLHIKDEDLKVWWYKKFFRDAYVNTSISKKQFAHLMVKCLRSV